MDHKKEALPALLLHYYDYLLLPWQVCFRVGKDGLLPLLGAWA